MTDSDQSQAATMGRTPEARARLATWLITVVVVVGFLCVLSSIYFRGIQNELILLNQQQMDRWTNISRHVDYLLGGDELAERPDRIVKALQSKLKSIHEDELGIQSAYRTELSSFGLRFWFALLGQSLEALEQDVSPSVRTYLVAVITAEAYIVQAGYSAWETTEVVGLLSGDAVVPLERRRDHLIDSAHRTDVLVRTAVLLILSIVTFCIWLMWATVLGPALQSLRSSYMSELENSERLDNLRLAIEDQANERKAILDHLPAMVVSLNANSELLAANQPYLDSFGITDISQVVGNHVSTGIGEDNWKALQPKVAEVLMGEAVQFEASLIGKSGLRRCQASYVPGKRDPKTNQITNFYALVIDIEEQASVVQSLRESEEKFRATLNSIGDAVVSTNTDGQIMYINPAASIMLGANLTRVKGEKIGSLLAIAERNTKEALPHPVDLVLSTAESHNRSDGVVLEFQNREPLVITYNASPIRSVTTRNVAGVVWSIRDISVEIELREQLLQSEKLKTIGQLASGINHDFNNILASMMNSVEVILSSNDQPLPANVVESIDVVVLGIKRAKNLANRLSISAHAEGGEFRPVDLVRIVEDICTILRQSTDKKTSIRVEQKSTHAVLVGDRGSLENAILNLCINAIDAMHDGGQLTITIADTVLGDNHINASTAGVVVSVCDTGCGIDPDIIERIYEPFFTTKDLGAGRGLGLASVQRCIAEHKAKISVDTSLGKGSCFHLEFATDRAEFPESEYKESTEKGQISASLLLIDDEELLLQSTIALLELIGVRVFSAPNAILGLELFEKHHDEIDGVLLDINMPLLSGVDAMQKLKIIDPDVKVIVVTGYADSAQIDNVLAHGARRILRKPYGISDLKRALKEELG